MVVTAKVGSERDNGTVCQNFLTGGTRSDPEKLSRNFETNWSQVRSQGTEVIGAGAIRLAR